MSEIKLLPASEWESGRVGLFSGVPDEVYFAGDEYSNSAFDDFDHSMITGKTAKENREDEGAEKDHFRVGRAVHARQADKEAFEAKYDTARQCSARKGDGKVCENIGKVRIAGKWYCGVKGHAPNAEPDKIEYVTEEELRWFGEWAERMADPAAYAIREILDLPGEHEVACRWIDDPTGITCRCKFDFLSVENLVAADYKTDTDATPREFSRTVNYRKYYRKEAFYSDGFFAVTGHRLEVFRFIALEKPPKGKPALVSVFHNPPEFVQVGRMEYRGILDRIAGCELTGYWPGLEVRKSVAVIPPSWRRDEIEIARSMIEQNSEETDGTPSAELPA